MRPENARRILEDARKAGIFPAAAAEVGSAAAVLWRDALGSRTFDDAAPIDRDTPFDLASLTKPMATAMLTMQLVEAGRLQLADRVGYFFDDWRGLDREAVTVRDLLEHSSGLPARLVDPPPAVRREFEHEICAIRLEYRPRTAALYSDLGFILLGFLVQDLAGEALDAQFARLWPRPALGFRLDAGPARRAAPTLPLNDDLRRGRLLAGEVHDNYAAALGGVAGHAGLFGTAAEVGAFARAVLGVLRAAPRASGLRGVPALALSERSLVEMTRRSSVPGSSRALGWDTMLPTSSCGAKMSTQAFGHVGFTGTSLWIDPGRDRYFALLTNRACGGGTIDEMRSVRRAFHDALAEK